MIVKRKNESFTLKDVSIFTGYSYIGRCKEFVWIPGDIIGNDRMPSRFIIKFLECEYDVEAIMLRKDLYLRTPNEQEYIVTNFLITDISDNNNILGQADSCELLFEKFPEMKTIVEGENVLISKQTQVYALQVMADVLKKVREGLSIDFKTLKEVASLIIEEIIKSPSALLNLVDVKSFDDYTYTHNINVSILATLIGYEMKLDHQDLYDLSVGALLHDIGKLKVPLSILNKDGKLSESEFQEMKKHSTYGYEILSCSKEINEKARLIALNHHEKFNGTGYPRGLKGGAIPLFARITAIADVYDALTTDRPYRVALSPHEAMKILTSGVETHFDPKILSVFLHKMSLYPSGSLVMLNDSSIALVLKANPNSVIRPVVKLLRSSSGERIKQRVEIDLMKTKDLFIISPASKNHLNIVKTNH